MKKAIVSSYKKDDELLKAANSLNEKGFQIFGSDGTHAFLTQNGINCSKLSHVTGFTSIANERVKTLSPVVYEAILSVEEIKDNPLCGLELVYVDLYPFPEGPYYDENVHLVDIGGVTLLRAAAKNYKRILPVFDVKDLIIYLENGVDEGSRERYAGRTFEFISEYDARIARSITGTSMVNLTETQELRYGENPHESGFIHKTSIKDTLLDLENHSNKKTPSLNNYYDLYIAIWAILKAKKPACSIVKHGNPIGISYGDDIEECFEKAYRTDKEAAFGGIFAFNRPLENEFLRRLGEYFFEILFIPEISEEGKNIIFGKRKNLRVFTGDIEKLDFKKTYRGFCGVILENVAEEYENELKVVSPYDKGILNDADIDLGLSVIRTYVSNSIILVKDGCIIGAGFGFPNRFEAFERALKQAGENAKGSVLVSDGFFPFSDILEHVKNNGIALIVQPGGSLNDKDLIEKSNQMGIGMIFTGKRTFRH